MKTVSKLHKRRGQATVELALVTPLLMIIVIGIFEFGRAWNQKQVITNAARDGARVAALTLNSGGNIADDSADNTMKRALSTAGMYPAGQLVDMVFVDQFQGCHGIGSDGAASPSRTRSRSWAHSCSGPPGGATSI